MTESSGELHVVNEFGQPVGISLKEWSPPPFPPLQTLKGKYCQLEPLESSRHAHNLWKALADDANGSRWTYMPFGPFASLESFQKWCEDTENAQDSQFYAIIVDRQAVGFFSYVHIEPSHGCIEVGGYYSLQLSKTRAATEVVYLLVANAFQLGYRRVEWKCDSYNLSSRNAATRLGFSYEGLFRQAVVYKGRSRDTTWFSIIDKDWTNGLKSGYERWLESSNFDENGRQKLKLSEMTAHAMS